MDYYDNLETFFVMVTMERQLLKPIRSGDSRT